MNVVRVLLAILLLMPAPTVFAQSTGTIRGAVTVGENGKPVKNASVIITELNRAANTDANGQFELTQIPAGKYTVISHLDGFPDTTATVEVASGGEATANFTMRLLSNDPVVVTVTTREENASQAFQSVTVLESTELAQRSQPSLGEVLDNQPGIAKRAFGPGPSRPIIRGFDGDRVLVLQNGLRAGGLGFQSGDHGEPIDPLSLERVEIVKGPATLLYGSSAVGGVVNTITAAQDTHNYRHNGLRGAVTGLGGTTNQLGGGSGALEYGHDRWLFSGGGGGQRTGDYNTPIGRIENSKNRTSHGQGTVGYFGDRSFFNVGYNYANGRFGIPFAADFEGEEKEARGAFGRSSRFRPLGAEGDEEVDLAFRRHGLRFEGGLRNLNGFFEGVRVSLNYSDYQHRELENNEVGTVFNNDEFTYRALFDQRRTGKVTGSFGVSGLVRKFETIGAERLAPPTDHTNFAAFALEQVNLERIQFQFGGRVETNRYRPEDNLPNRNFTGFSGAAGIRVPLFTGAAFVANYTHSYRAPALEELYNNGPHLGTLTFEIGNPNLRREQTNGIDTSFRYTGNRLRGEANFYYYDIKGFVFLSPTGEREDNFPVGQFSQADSRFVGTEASVSYRFSSYFSIDGSLDAVDAEIKNSNSPLPRIPPFRGRIGGDFFYKGFNLRPEVLMARAQNQVFPTETPTAGYGVVNLKASYTLVQNHASHTFSVNAFNLADKLYRNHTTLIKDLAPEIGRGVRFTYTMRFF